MKPAKKWILKLFSAILISTMILTVHPGLVAQASITPTVTETGYISWSIDGIAGAGPVQVQKPSGAVVRKAFIAASSSPSAILSPGAVAINGNTIVWDSSKTVIGPYNMSNYWSEVTSIIKPAIDAALPGRIDFTISNASNSLEALALIVIFDDPNQTVQNTIILMSGSQDPAGDDSAVMLANPINKSKAGFALNMSLGIAFGYQPDVSTTAPIAQYSRVGVNDHLITSSAGGQDDTVVANNKLATVGGLDDSIDNPIDPTSSFGNYRSDDELYSLIPFVDNGDTSINVHTQNPSNDDNIFFIGYFFGANTALVSGGTAPGILSVSPDTGSPSGGDSVVISGINLAGATSVTFGGTAANLSSCAISSTSIICPIPVHDSNLVDISVTTPYGTATLSDAFTYQGPASTPTPTPAAENDSEEISSVLPVTGFPIGLQTILPAQSALNVYSDTQMVLEIPSLNISAPIAGIPLVDSKWDVSWLENKVGYLQGSAFPTWPGNTVLTGHVWNADNTPGVFVNLKQLRYGDHFQIQAFGQTYTYEVRENKLLSPVDVSSVFKHQELDWVTLLTCEGFNSENDTYSYRRAVTAVLVNVK